MKKKKKKSAGEKLSSFLDLPLDTVCDVPRITINDNRELSVENYKSIEEYEPEEIKLRSRDYCITVSGRDLRIIAITDDEILVHGAICGVTLGM